MKVCGKGRARRGEEEGQTVPFYTLISSHGGGVWRDWLVHSVASNNAYAGLSDSKSLQLKTIQGTVTGYAGDLGESSNRGVKTPDLVVLWQHYPLEHDG